MALGAAAFFAYQSHQQIRDRRTAVRSFETTARDATDALDAAHAGQRAYVALNQDPGDWFPRVVTYLQTASASIDSLRASAQSTTARPALLDASAAMTELGNLDRRMRTALGAEDAQAAVEVVFVDAADAVSKAVSNIDTAREAELQAADAFERARERAAASGLAGAGVFAALALAVLAMAPRGGGEAHAGIDTESDEIDAGPAEGSGRLSLALDVRAAADPKPAPPEPVAADGGSLQALLSAADVCTALGRVREAGEIRALLQRAADGMHARGLIVWLGSARGAALRPVLAHGYSDQTLLKIPSIPRDADNATASAYRLGEMQVVKSREDGAQGAVVAPLLVADGCIGALTAEVRGQGEQSEVVRAVAAIVAAQLAGILQGAVADAAGAAEGAREAAGG